MSQSAPRSYPRSKPYEPPRDRAAREARLWRWTLLLLGSTAVSVFVLVAGGIFVLNRASAKRPEPAKPSPAAPRTWVRDLTPAVAVALESKPPLAAQPPESPPDPGKPAEANQPPERLLEALGGLTAAHLYQSYLTIGLLADNAESEVYTTAEAKKLLETLTSLLNTVDRQLSRIGEQDLKPDDRKALERTLRLVAQLRTQADELNAYWTTGDKEHTLKFHKAREEAWAGIRELLGIPE